MLLSFDETLKEHLNILNSFDETVVAEFCKIAINFLNKGGKVGEKSLQSAASKLGLETKQIKYENSRNPPNESSTCNHPQPSCRRRLTNYMRFPTLAIFSKSSSQR